jgi:(E)-4-hydroxy-3-methylbut-2-enyl-diphosphate synthase
MTEEGMNYPLHLGVTEAGGGEDGRIKSAVGIGALLEDGIGDTIRVSLTEDPEYEVPVAISLADRYKIRNNSKPIKHIEQIPIDLFSYSRRETNEVSGIGGHHVPVVIADFSKRKINSENDLKDIGFSYNKETDKWNLSDSAGDILYLGKDKLPFNYLSGLKVLYDYETWKNEVNNEFCFPLLNKSDYLANKPLSHQLNFLKINIDELDSNLISKIQDDRSVVLILETFNLNAMAELRRLYFELIENEIKSPAIIKRSYSVISFDELRLYASTDFGGLLIDGFGDGVWMSVENLNHSEESEKNYVRSFINKNESEQKIINRTLFGILQATRTRISKTEYIACPSCGRTLFDLQVTTEMIRKRTEHLKGVKIAVMGCIVNGPGEMADADYGYVGSGIDKITLYRGKDVVKRNIPSSGAVDALIDLIKEDGNWRNPHQND